MKAFTIVEIIIAVVCLGLVAAFALPNYKMALQKQQEKVIAVNLDAVKGALDIYKSTHGGYPTSGIGTLSEINSVLGLNIIPSKGETYYCLDTGDPAAFDCRGTTDHGWGLHISAWDANFQQIPLAHCLLSWEGEPNACPACIGPAPLSPENLCMCPWLPGT